MIRLFVGHDPREAVAFDVFAHSVITRASEPVALVPLVLGSLAKRYSETHTDGSNQFIYSRFLVPFLCDFQGWAIFADGDMLCRADIAELWALRDPNKAVQVVQHDYKTKHATKYLGSRNDDYPRKNWSSVIIFNCAHPKNQWLRPKCIASATGSYLHRFSWLEDRDIGRLPKTWNHLVGEYDPDPAAKLLHYTLGTPCFRGYELGDEAAWWYAELDKILDVPEKSILLPK